MRLTFGSLHVLLKAPLYRFVRTERPVFAKAAEALEEVSGSAGAGVPVSCPLCIPLLTAGC